MIEQITAYFECLFSHHRNLKERIMALSANVEKLTTDVASLSTAVDQVAALVASQAAGMGTSAEDTAALTAANTQIEILTAKLAALVPAPTV